MTTDHITFTDSADDDERVDATLSGLGAVGVERISATQIGMYGRCQRQWAYRYVLGLKVPPDGGLLVGSGVHHAAEVGMIHKADTGEDPAPEMAAEAASEYVHEQCATGEVRMDDTTPGDLADKSVRLAVAWAEQAAPGVVPLEVEQEFTTDIAGVPVTGRMDVVTATSIVDWKTAGKSPNVDDHVASPQTEVYAYVSGRPIQYEFLVDLKSGVKHVSVPVAGEDAERARRMAHDTVAEVAAGMAMGVWPRNRRGWHCSKRFCGYYDRCMSGRDDATLQARAADARGAAGVMW